MTTPMRMLHDKARQNEKINAHVARENTAQWQYQRTCYSTKHKRMTTSMHKLLDKTQQNDNTNAHVIRRFASYLLLEI